jgi:hypothetical protein
MRYVARGLGRAMTNQGVGMIRAGVFIGVDRAAPLQRLNDAAKGASRMRDWAVSQGMVRHTQTRLITDKKEPVDPSAIKKAIKDLLQGAGVDQLIVYFAGHGLTVNLSETWLLTDAPEDPSAAVNVAASVDLARYCGIQHVVVISDACRNAAAGIQQGGSRAFRSSPTTWPATPPSRWTSSSPVHGVQRPSRSRTRRRTTRRSTRRRC